MLGNPFLPLSRFGRGPAASRRRSPYRLTVEVLEDRLTPTRIAVIGDYGAAGPAEQHVSALVHGWAPDQTVTLGDNNYPDGAAATIDANIGQYYHDYIAPYHGSYGAGSATNRFWPALGNEDYNPSTGPSAYLNYFTLPNN